MPSDPDAGIQVAITPSQSAYFAGEPFSVTITFTNTRSVEYGPSKSATYAHKRGAHSISSAPLARPPTSPGIPRTPVAPWIARANDHADAPIRRGLVGLNSEDRQLHESTPDQQRKRLLGKSLSVSIAPPELETELSQTPSAGANQRTFQDSGNSFRSPLVPATIPRTDALSLSQNHPHARKQSLIVDSRFVQEHTHPTYPYAVTPTSSTSSFSLALDPIAEASMGALSSYPNTPILGSPSIEPASPSRFAMPAGSVYAYPSSSASSSSSSLGRPLRPSNLGLGYPQTNSNRHPHPRAPPHLHPPRSAFSSSFPPQQNNSELILYSYAQLTGSVVITPVPGATLTEDQALNMKHVRESLLKRNVVGGGSMDINSSLLNRTRSGSEYPASPPGVLSASGGGVVGRMSTGGNAAHGRTNSLTGALFSMLSPTGLLGSSANCPATEQLTSPDSPSSPVVQGRWRSSSASAGTFSDAGPESPQTPTGSFSGVGRGVGLGLELGAGLDLPTTAGGGQGLAVPSSPYTSTTSLGSSGLGNRSRRGSNSSTYTATHSRRSSVAWILGGGGESNYHSSIGGGNNDPLAHLDAETPLPTFEVQPAMLAVDLALAPGESRSYTYTVNIPENLPPTFRGKAIRFSYELVVGLCRAGPSGTGLTSTHLELPQSHHSGAGSNVSKLMKIPIRMYNHVMVDRASKPYNLLWPVDRRMDLGMPSSQPKVVENDKSSGTASGTGPNSPDTRALSLMKTPTGGKGNEGGLEDLVRYTKGLLNSLPLPPSPTPTPAPAAVSQLAGPSIEHTSPSHEGASGKGHKAKEPKFQPDTTTAPTSLNSTSPPDSTSPSPVQTGSETATTKTGGDGIPVLPSLASASAHPPRRPVDLNSEFYREKDREERSRDGMMSGGCREAVEILTRTQKKASYDVTKDGVKVAVLTFPKSSYRLGETINGVVELNERTGRARVLQLSAFLEAHESLPSSLLPASANKHLRRTYAEHFSSFLLNTLRTTFSLDIPSDASPAFQTCVSTPRMMAGLPASVPGGTTMSYGGVEWKVRLCLLVGVSGEDADVGTEDVRFKSLVRDGPRGEWSSGWKALEVVCPLEKERARPRRVAVVKEKNKKGRRPGSLFLGSNGGDGVAVGSGARSSSPVSWSAFFASYLSPSSEREYHDGDEPGEEEVEETGYAFFGGSFKSFGKDGVVDDDGYDGIKPDLGGGVGRGVDFGGGEVGWKGVRLEMVECEVPVRVWPGNTAFKAMDVVFEV